ncbi:MAG TPA: DUF5947 family protein, partial [Gemmataceae bacterium]|nr:DUF5947 family protein [Gemmataceae bacterium]
MGSRPPAFRFPSPGREPRMHARTPDVRPPRRGPLATLDRFARSPAAVERCDLCGIALESGHEHLAEPAARRLLCCCPACALLFSAQEGGRYRRVSPRCEPLPDLQVPDGLWDLLGVPVGLAFFVSRSTASGVVAVYPSPAGPLESQVAAEEWAAIVAANAALRDLEPDVEALLVNRTGGARDQFRVSLDRCYELIGLI